ncbi:atrial natriuretic peptide receptor 3-like [Babylonia areolata]|uniref:atrial natriuretic peptide receptor 3-like n=1 Tax=Babylonia areolata TaxID=304850 RepID=UPI003FD07EF7
MAFEAILSMWSWWSWWMMMIVISSSGGGLVLGQNVSSSSSLATIHFAALLPSQQARFLFAYRNVLPALKLAVDNVTAPEGPLPGRDIQVHFRDSECSSAAAMNQMYNFYIQKKVHVFFGPCCDYAAAPVGRQLHYWKLPMLTAGAIARDFALGKQGNYDLITRVGASINSLLDFLLEIMHEFKWKRIKQVYDPVAQDMVGDKVCHIVTDGLHYGLKYQDIIPGVEQDYEKFESVDSLLERLPEEIGDWAGGGDWVVWRMEVVLWLGVFVFRVC